MKKLLLADDSATIERMVRLNFEGDEIEIICARDGDQAILLFERDKPDVVLADIYMPGKNGYDVCEYIKNHSRFFQTPVLLLRGSFEPFSDEEYSRVRADGVLTKPLDSSQLVHWVHRLLEQSDTLPTLNGPALSESNLIEFPAPSDSQDCQPSQPEIKVDRSEEVYTPDTKGSKTVEDSPGFITEESDFLEIELSGLSYPGSETEDLLLEIPPLEIIKGREELTPGSTPSPTEISTEQSAVSVEEEAVVPSLPDSLPPSPEMIEPPLPLTTDSSRLTQPGTSETAPKKIPDTAVPMPPPLFERLSDEDIDRIAQCVVTRLSDRVLREIAWEILPDMAELIVKQELKKLPNASL